MCSSRKYQYLPYERVFFSEIHPHLAIPVNKLCTFLEMFLLQKPNPRKFQFILCGGRGSMDISLNCTLFFEQPANFQMGGELKLKPLEGTHFFWKGWFGTNWKVRTAGWLKISWNVWWSWHLIERREGNNNIPCCFTPWKP